MRKNNSLGLSGKQVYSDENPFMKDIVDAGFLQCKRGRVEHLDCTKVDEVTGARRMMYYKELTNLFHDRRSFFKVFYNEVGDRMRGWSANEYSLYFHIGANLVYARDEVYLDPHKAMEYLGTKCISVLYKALNGLIERCVIARKIQYGLVFWINPLFMFRGDIILRYVEYIKTQFIINKQMSKADMAVLQSIQQFKKKVSDEFAVDKLLSDVASCEKFEHENIMLLNDTGERIDSDEEDIIPAL